MRFSQRIGKVPIKTVIQVESIDTDLKNRLWNIVLESFLDQLNDDLFREETEKGQVCKLIWKEFFRFRVDDIPMYNNGKYVNIKGVIEDLRKWFFTVEWYEIYDFIEFIIQYKNFVYHSRFIIACNNALEKEVSGYRIVNEKIVQITSLEEINEIEDALELGDKWKSVNTHLRSALDLLADRKNPDYRNSIKEAISSVESFCIIITDEKSATLGKALIEIEKKYSLHGALKNAFSALYGYTSDSGGIRHALLEDDSKIGFEDAKFMLVTCSAFINYLKVKMSL